MLLDNLFGDRQPKSRTLGLGAEERLKRLGDLVRTHPFPTVFNFDARARLTGRVVGRARTDADLPARGAGLNGVQYQVHQHLLQLVRIGIHRRYQTLAATRSDVLFDYVEARLARFAFQERYGAIDDVGEVDDLQLRL